MKINELFELKERLINEAIKYSKTLPESEQVSYVNTYIEATMSFFTYSFIASLDEETTKKEKKKSA